LCSFQVQDFAITQSHSQELNQPRNWARFPLGYRLLLLQPRELDEIGILVFKQIQLGFWGQFPRRIAPMGWDFQGKGGKSQRCSNYAIRA
jgi:hypothetical protein